VGTRATTADPVARPPLLPAWWAHLPLRRKGIVVLALPVLALLVAPAAFVLADQADRRAQSLVSRTLAINAQFRRVLGLVVDEETAARGFLLTRDDAFLDEPGRTRRPHRRGLRRPSLRRLAHGEYLGHGPPRGRGARPPSSNNATAVDVDAGHRGHGLIQQRHLDLTRGSKHEVIGPPGRVP
jgi:hypothetical protein